MFIIVIVLLTLTVFVTYFVERYLWLVFVVTVLLDCLFAKVAITSPIKRNIFHICIVFLYFFSSTISALCSTCCGMSIISWFPLSKVIKEDGSDWFVGTPSLPCIRI